MVEQLAPGSLTSVASTRHVLAVTVSSRDQSHHSSHRIVSDAEVTAWADGSLWPSRIDDEHVVLR